MTPRRADPGSPTTPQDAAENQERAPWRGTLRLLIDCPPDRRSEHGNRHAITIAEDWTVTTPHDIDAERVGAALGGYCACIDLIDKAVPAVREGMDHLLRAADVTMARNKPGSIRILKSTTTRPCCTRYRYRDVLEASQHLRSAEHLSHLNNAPTWQVQQLIHAIVQECTPDFGTFRELENRIREAHGVAALWDHGIHPDEALRQLELVPTVTDPLPLDYFLGVAYSGINRGWLTQVVACRPDADTASWLAWAPEIARQTNIHEWRTWIGFGLSRADTQYAILEQLPASLVTDTASETGWTAKHSALTLIAWTRAGCAPTVRHMRELAERRIDHGSPTGVALDALRRAAAADPDIDLTRLNRTELCLLLEILGTIPAVIAALRQGIHTVDELDTTLTHDNPWRIT